MSSDYSPSSSRRSRRGGRRPGRGQGSRSPRPESSSRPAAPKKKTLWQKIIAFFTGESAAPAAKSTHSSSPRQRSEGTSNSSTPAPARAERSERPVSRKPEIVDVTSPRVYVGNLSFDASESDLQELFSGVGLVQNVEVVANRHTHKSKGFGFVQMQTVDEARRAVEVLHDKEYMGRKLVVSGAKALEEKRSDRQQRQPEQ